MAIWNYESQTRDALLELMRVSACAFCGNALHRFDPITEKKPWGDCDEWRVRVCQACGWWKITKIEHVDEGALYRGFRSAAAGTLKQLDLSNIDQPISEVRSYLLARYEARQEADPALFERTVASVFSDLGYSVLVTAGSGDGGIDMLLYRSDGGVIGVQVKRYRNAIEVAQIRELLGALMLAKLTKGVFITTFRFQSGAARIAKEAEGAGFFIELVDGDTFLQALRLSQREQFTSKDLPSLIERSVYTKISDTGTLRLGIGSIYNPDGLKGYPGPGGPQDEWP